MKIFKLFGIFVAVAILLAAILIDSSSFITPQSIQYDNFDYQLSAQEQSIFDNRKNSIGPVAMVGRPDYSSSPAESKVESPVESKAEPQKEEQPAPPVEPEPIVQNDPPPPEPIDDVEQIETFTAAISVKTVSAPGTQVQHGTYTTIDFSNVNHGYVMVRKNTDLRVRMRVIKDDTVYSRYILPARDIFYPIPLQSGSGTYTVDILTNTMEISSNVFKMDNTLFATDNTVTFQADLVSEEIYSLSPNIYSNFDNNSAVVQKAYDLTAGSGGDDLQKVKSIYNWMITNIAYDRAKVNTVSVDYIPNPDNILAVRKGICFDYASLMTAMLRSVNVQTRLIIGTVRTSSGTTTHAWIEVYISSSGWISDGITTSGNCWVMLDPTIGVNGARAVANSTYVKQETY